MWNCHLYSRVAARENCNETLCLFDYSFKLNVWQASAALRKPPTIITGITTIGITATRRPPTGTIIALTGPAEVTMRSRPDKYQ
jgi:hypothetical protein